jgi:hypothetical protein
MPERAAWENGCHLKPRRESTRLRMTTDAAEARRQNRRYRHRANRELNDENAMAEAEKTRRDKPAK